MLPSADMNTNYIHFPETAQTFVIASQEVKNRNKLPRRHEEHDGKFTKIAHQYPAAETLHQDFAGSS
jgi:hypothetical protein